MSFPVQLQWLVAVVTIASVSAVVLLPVLAGQLLRGCLVRAARIAAAIAVLAAVGYATSMAIATFAIGTRFPA
jgi:hypothetical protein